MWPWARALQPLRRVQGQGVAVDPSPQGAAGRSGWHHAYAAPGGQVHHHRRPVLGSGHVP